MGVFKDAWMLVVGWWPETESAHGGPKSSAANVAVPGTEIIGGVSVPSRVVSERALSTREIRQLVDSIKEALVPTLATGQASIRAENLVDRLIVRFAAYVMDLPASEHNHHSGKGGLLIHSLETARQAFLKAQGRRFEHTTDPVSIYKAKPIWDYLAFLFGLTHDLGKVFDVEMVAGEQLWDPLAEPLATFLVRNPASKYVHRAGRTIQHHEELGKYVFRSILTPEICSYVQPIIVEALLRETPTSNQLWSDVFHSDACSARLDSSPASMPPASANETQAKGETPASQDSPVASDMEQFVRHLMVNVAQGAITTNDPKKPMVLVGTDYAVLSLRGALEVLAKSIKVTDPDAMEHEDKAVALAHHLKAQGLLFKEPGTDRVKLHFRFDVPEDHPAADKAQREGECVLLPLRNPETSGIKKYGIFPFALRIVDDGGHLIDVPGFKCQTSKSQTKKKAASAAPSAPVKDPAQAKAGGPMERRRTVSLPTERAKLPPRKEIRVDEANLLLDLKQAILDGTILRNVGGKAHVFITYEWTYILIPDAFVALEKLGYPDPTPRAAVYPFLDALVRKHPRVIWHNPESKNHSQFRIETPPGSAALGAIALDTGLFFTGPEVEELGYWQFPVIHHDTGNGKPAGGGRVPSPSTDEPAEDKSAAGEQGQVDKPQTKTKKDRPKKRDEQEDGHAGDL
jgi:hypothetical protein